MLRLIIGRDWTANRNEILRRISADVGQRREGIVLMVPELISHETERRLCAAAGDTASRYAEVLSFTRLARRVADSVGSAAEVCLDNGGRVAVMAAVTRQLHSRLKAYAAVETKPEFLTALVDAVDEFKRCCISPADLAAAAASASGALAQKLEELALIMEGYDALCSRGKRDPRDQMTWCLEQMEQGEFAQTHRFYIDGFPDFTRQHMAILEHLISFSPSVTVSLNCDSLDSPLLAFEKAASTGRDILEIARRVGVEVQIQTLQAPPMPLDIVREKLFQGGFARGAAKGAVRAYRARSPYQEALGAAQQVMELVRSGCRYRDITLVCGDMAAYRPLVNLAFHRMHIPVYQSGTEDILQESVVCTVLNGLEAALSGFDQRSTLRYLRSALSPLSPEECDEVENYAILWGIRGLKWTLVWVNHPEGLSGQWSEETDRTLERLNSLRAGAIDPLERLRQSFQEAGNISGQVSALYGFLEEICLEQRLTQLAEALDASGDNRGAQILNQLWEILLSALEQLQDTLGETAWEPEQFARLLRLLLSQYDVGTIPPVLDAVQMGQTSAMRCHQQKHLIVLGAQEGSLPGYSGASGVLTDQERVALRNMGVPLTGGAMEGIQAEFAEIYGVFCGAMESISIYCSAEQPSFVFRRLAELAGNIEEVDAPMGYAPAEKTEAAAYLARWNGGQAAERLGIGGEYGEICRRRDYSLGAVAQENIRGLYGGTLNLSASQVDRQAECRLSYFLQYGLRVKERKEATVDPAEFGTYVHAVLEQTCRSIRDMGGFHAVSLEETVELAHRYSEDYAREHFAQLDSQRMAYLFRRNIQELDMVVRELWRELSASQFAPEGFEINFGPPGTLPPIAIPNGSMPALLRGFIDRMDTWAHNGRTYYRVVDYKTGKKEFDYCDIFNGVGLQMLLYLFALRESGEESLGQSPVAAGVQYFPARAPYLTADGALEDSAAEDIRRKAWKRPGLVLENPEVLDAMDAEGSTLGKDTADSGQMALLEGYLFRTLGKMVEEIASGCVEPNPYTRGESHNACTFCPYGRICHQANVPGRRNFEKIDAQRFWRDVGKEMEHHGG